MTDWLLSLVPQYGLWLLAATTFLACLALPFPASILMLTAGGFVAAGDLVLWQTCLAATGGAIAGDQVGYWAGRRFGTPILSRMRKDKARDKLLARANALIERRGVLAVFFSRWLVSPLGPWVNLTAGSTAYHWPRFTVAAVAGEAVWAGLYIGTGHAFAGNVEAASEMLGSVLGLIAGGAAALALGYWLWAASRSDVAAALPNAEG